MIITIQIDTTADLSPEELSVLRGIYRENNSADPNVGDLRAKLAGGTKDVYVEQKPAPEAPKKRGPGRPRKTETPAPEPVAEEAPIPTAEESLKAIEELYEDDETPAVLEDAPVKEDGPTLEDAVQAATPLISGGKAAVVKSALADLGVKRVGELPADKIQDFLDALKEG